MIKKKDKKKESSFFEFLKTIFYAVIIAVIFRSLFFEPYNIPSGSMLPNLLIGDYLFVSKYSYGYSRYSFPFGIVPLPENRVFASEPKRGDVAVFKLPSNTNINYIKRVMGLPGDKIQMKSGKLFINGSLVIQEEDGFYRHIIKNKFEQILEQKKERLNELRNEFDLDANDIVIILVGRMIWSKGIKEFVYAAKVLNKRGIKSKFIPPFSIKLSLPWILISSKVSTQSDANPGHIISKFFIPLPGKDSIVLS